jgi:hypothetical protein
MTAATPTEISVEDIPQNLAYGTARRRVLITVRVTTTSGYTIDLSSTVKNLAGIDGISMVSHGGAKTTSATSVTWSTVTLTINSTTATVVQVVGYLT